MIHLKLKNNNVMKQSIPTILRHDDLYLVEFPKSGVTWLSFLITNANLLLRGDFAQYATFFNISSHVAELDVTSDIAQVAPPLPGFRVIKSHSPYNGKFRRVFYVVRDPRMIMASYRQFVESAEGNDIPIAEFIEHKRYGVQAWRAHVAGWLDKVPIGHSFALVRYEDLLSDTVCELGTLYALLGFVVPTDTLAQAVERSSLAKMRESEALFFSRHPRGANMKFVREGSLGDPREPLSPAIQERIAELAGPLAKQLGYDLSEKLPYK